MKYIFSFIIVLIFIHIRRKMWLETPLNAESFSYCFFKENNGKIHKFFQLPLSAISIYILGLSYNISIEFGKRVFEITIASTGLFLAISAYLLTESNAIFYLVLITMLATAIIPNTFDCEAEPEAFSNFFTSLGLLLLIIANQSGSTLGIALATLVSSVGFWCKLSAIEILWGPAYLFLLHGFGLKVAIALSTLGLSALAYTLVLYTCSRITQDAATNQTSLLQNALAYQKYDLCLRAQKGNTRVDIAAFWSKLIDHQEIIFPLTTLFFLYFTLSPTTKTSELTIATWAIISFTHCILRNQFRPLYFYMAHFPLAVGAGQFLIERQDVLANHWLALTPILLLLFSISSRAIRNTTTRPQWKDRLKILKDGVLTYLSSRVSKEDAVFQDGGWLMLYPCLGCKHPPHPFTWADRMRYHFEDPKLTRTFLNFFQELKPKYLIIGLKHINLTHLEQIVGLRYRLVRHNQFSIYKLCGTTDPLMSDFNPDRLFRFDRIRLKQDINQLTKENFKTMNDVITLLNFNKFNSALSLLQTVEDTSIRTPNLHLLKALALIKLGETAKAETELRKEIAINPSNQEALNTLKTLATNSL